MTTRCGQLICGCRDTVVLEIDQWVGISMDTFGRRLRVVHEVSIGLAATVAMTVGLGPTDAEDHD